MDSRVFGVTVCKNEADRYLQSCLAWTRPLVEHIFVYDDQSTDSSFDIASRMEGVSFVVRPDSVPPFLVHEGRFRQAGWDAFVQHIQPTENDFIFAFDLDEFWHGPSFNVLISELGGNSGGILVRPEVWTVDPLIIRVDDLWKTIRNIRFFPFRENGKFKDQELAGGSHPLYAEGKTIKLSGNLLHCGYASPEDRKERYDRYINRGGHNTRHIRTILGSSPTLESYSADLGPLPKIWKGIENENI